MPLIAQHRSLLTDLPALRLRRREERRILAGHLWVFSNEVDTARTPLTGFEPGDPVRVEASDGRPLGTGYVNPRSLICARLLSRDARVMPDADLVHARIANALRLRERLFTEPFYRALYGDGDLLSGLVVDRFGDHLVVQVTTAGMERLLPAALEALREILQPSGILLRNDSRGRELEGLDRYVRVIEGDVPEEVEIVENGVRFLAPLAGGQKTGWFYDHRPNRARLSRYVARGGRVLDLFGYVGGWGVQAAVAGASEVVCVDRSAAALETAERNAELNGVGDRFRTVEDDAFQALERMAAGGERFDVVVADPPALIPRRRDRKAGERAYGRLNRLAFSVLDADGILVSASCSYHLPRDRHRDILRREALAAGIDLRILEEGGQGPDHPVHPAIPETEYLTCVTASVSPAVRPLSPGRVDDVGPD
jgi:23S rRNA (cytosine1962-C5)-methyltransferase